MWIRSQDKEALVNCEAIYINDSIEGDAIFGTSSSGACVILGFYSSAEKRQKVLDMFESKLIAIDKAKFNGCENEYYVNCIFQIPQDNEVEE